jgi:hypothetical protein
MKPFWRRSLDAGPLNRPFVGGRGWSRRRRRVQGQTTKVEMRWGKLDGHDGLHPKAIGVTEAKSANPGSRPPNSINEQHFHVAKPPPSPGHPPIARPIRQTGTRISDLSPLRALLALPPFAVPHFYFRFSYISACVPTSRSPPVHPRCTTFSGSFRLASPPSIRLLSSHLRSIDRAWWVTSSRHAPSTEATIRCARTG